MKNTMAASADDEGRVRAKKASTEGGVFSAIGEWPQRTKTFLGDVRAETRRVTWPSMEQVRSTTVVVIVTVFFFGAYIGALDWLYTRAIAWVLKLGG